MPRGMLGKGLECPTPPTEGFRFRWAGGGKFERGGIRNGFHGARGPDKPVVAKPLEPWRCDAPVSPPAARPAFHPTRPGSGLGGRMEEATAHLREGVLSHLEKLEAYARKLAQKQEETEQQQEKLAQLRARIQELRLQRDELQTKVNLQQVGFIRPEGATGSNVEPVQAAETRDQALLEWKVENAKAMLQAFYLTGISGKLTKHGACFCISTAYEGTYLDSYYLDLLMQQPVQIRRHSVPVFIPLEQIAKKYLQTDIKCFLATLSEHLNAYAGRKYQADQLQDHFSAFLEGTLQRNSLHNVLFFNYDVETESKTFPFMAKLLYGDLTRSLPTEAIVMCKGDVCDSLVEKKAAHANLFRHTALHKAFDSFKRAAESLDQTA